MQTLTRIYALNDPVTGKMRYLGKAHNPYRRWQTHIAKAPKSRTHCGCWINSLLSQGLKPELEILDEVPVAEWQFWEREYIRVFKAIGIPLTNHTPGGEGGSEVGRRYSVEISKKMGAANKGRIHSDEARENMSRAHTGLKHSLETLQKMRDTRGGHVCSQRTKDKIGAGNLGKRRSFFVKEKMKASQGARRQREREAKLQNGNIT